MKRNLASAIAISTRLGLPSLVGRVAGFAVTNRRRVEMTGKPVTITRRGKAVAQLEPPPAPAAAGLKPWERLRGKARWLADPGEGFISEKDIRGL